MKINKKSRLNFFAGFLVYVTKFCFGKCFEACAPEPFKAYAAAVLNPLCGEALCRDGVFGGEVLRHFASEIFLNY